MNNPTCHHVRSGTRAVLVALCALTLSVTAPVAAAAATMIDQQEDVEKLKKDLSMYRNTVIAVGTVCGVFLIAIVILVIFLVREYKKRREVEARLKITVSRLHEAEDQRCAMQRDRDRKVEQALREIRANTSLARVGSSVYMNSAMETEREILWDKHSPWARDVQKQRSAGKPTVAMDATTVQQLISDNRRRGQSQTSRQSTTNDSQPYVGTNDLALWSIGI